MPEIKNMYRSREARDPVLIDGEGQLFIIDHEETQGIKVGSPMVKLFLIPTQDTIDYYGLNPQDFKSGVIDIIVSISNLKIGNLDKTFGRRFLVTNFKGEPTNLSRMHEDLLSQLGELNNKNNIKEIRILKLTKEIREIQLRFEEILKYNKKLSRLVGSGPSPEVGEA